MLDCRRNSLCCKATRNDVDRYLWAVTICRPFTWMEVNLFDHQQQIITRIAEVTERLEVISGSSGTYRALTERIRVAGRCCR